MMKFRSLIICVFVFPGVIIASQGNAQSDRLRVYMPREVSISDTVITLGEVAIVRSEKQEMVDKAESLKLGQFSTIGQEIVIDRATLKSRMACENIDMSKLKITGAQETVITQKHISIKSAKLVEIAEMALKNAAKPVSVSSWSPIRMPGDFSVNSASKNVDYQTSIVQSNVPSCAKVKIDIFVDDVKVGTKTVTFRYQFSCRRAVSTCVIAAGSTLSADNVKIVKYNSTQPEVGNWKSPYGLVARRKIPAKTIINNSIVVSKTSDVLVKRNDNVVVRIDTPALTISAMGRALEDGRAGQCVKVRMNISPSSQRVIFARVKPDGTLEPIS